MEHSRINGGSYKISSKHVTTLPSKLFAAAIAWMSPVRCKLNSSIGITYTEIRKGAVRDDLTIAAASSPAFNSKCGSLAWLSYTSEC